MSQVGFCPHESYSLVQRYLPLTVLWISIYLCADKREAALHFELLLGIDPPETQIKSECKSCHVTYRHTSIV